jgi:hypothetical protein
MSLIIAKKNSLSNDTIAKSYLKTLMYFVAFIYIRSYVT